MVILTTERLHLRQWQESDRLPFAEMNADPRVTEFIGKSLTREESDRRFDRIEASFEQHGFGLYAAELRADLSFLGFIGLPCRISRPLSPHASK
jgi:RimJ/RimL family protein N-acetyltransferase